MFNPVVVNPVVRCVLWKEFRSQRAVLVAIAAELLLLQFFLGTFGFHGFGFRGLLSVSFVLTGCLAMTTCAMLFAAESESGTDHWLRQLPLTSRDLLTGKLGYGLITVFGFLILGVMTTLLITALRTAITGQAVGGSVSILNDPVIFANSVFGLSVWGLLYSLMLRRVMATVVFTAITEIMVSGILYGTLTSIYESSVPAYVAYWLVVAIVAMIDIRLMKRWTGLEPAMNASTENLTSVESSAPSSGSAVLFPTLRYVRWSTLTKCESAGWLWMLRKMESIPNRLIRRVAPMMWIEFRWALPVVSVGVVLLVTLSLMIIWPLRHHPGVVSADLPVLYHLYCLTAMIFGLFTIIPDRIRGTLAFFAERGVSARTIVFMKVFVWGAAVGLGLFVPLFALLFTDPTDFSLRWLSHLTLDRTLAIPGLQQFQPEFQRSIMLRLTAASPSIGFFLSLAGSFTIGVLAALWIRRPIIAGITAVGGIVVWLGWVSLTASFFIPAGRTLVVPLAMIWLAIFWTANASVLEWTTWFAKAGRMIWLLLVVLTGLLSYRDFRMNEIPDDTSALPAEVTAVVSPASDGYWGSWRPVASCPTDVGEQKRLREYLDQLADDGSANAALNRETSFYEKQNSFVSTTFRSAIHTLNLEAPSCDLDASFAHLVKWLSVTKKMGESAPREADYMEFLTARRIVLSAIRRWANHSEQTLARLELACKTFQGNAFSTAPPLITQPWRRQRTAVLKKLESIEDSYQYGWLLVVTGEKERLRRLVDQYFLVAQSEGNGQSQSAKYEAYDFWELTSSAARNAFHFRLPDRQTGVRLSEQWKLAFSADVATELTLQLQRWRLKHGEFPAGIPDLFSDEDTRPGSWRFYWLRDIVSNSNYGYESKGFPAVLTVANQVVIPARQPILYSMGLHEPRGISLTPVPPGTTDGQQIAFRAMSAAYGDTFQGKGSSGNPLPMHRAASDRTIRFVILGEPVDEDSLCNLSRSQNELIENTKVPGQAAPDGD
jgi:hypothetical protein